MSKLNLQKYIKFLIFLQNNDIIKIICVMYEHHWK